MNQNPIAHWCSAVFLAWACSFSAYASPLMDGPPSRHVDVSSVPDLVPRAEPLSKRGNNPRYQVFGRWYQTLKSAKNYRARGIASWYGTKFHKHHTANGEVYDMFGMTAAHKSLPLPTFLKVTNLDNLREIIVRVNDRGPFHDQRLIDLSYAAAAKLGILAHGTGRVEISAVDPYESLMITDATAEPEEPVAPAVKGYLQVGVFQQYSNASRIAHKIADLTQRNVNIEQVKKANRAVFYVKLGPIDLTKGLPSYLQSQLQEAGYRDSIVVRA